MVYEIRIMKKITVIISAGDTDKYMEETLDSLSAQSIVNDIEIIDQTKPGQITRGDEVLNKAEGEDLYFMNSGICSLHLLWKSCGIYVRRNIWIFCCFPGQFFMKIQNSRNDIKIFQMNFTDAALTRR